MTISITGTLQQVTNSETFELDLEFVDDTTDAAWFLQVSPPDEITIKVRDADGVEQLSGSLTGGEIVVTGDGEARLTFTYTQMGALDAPKTYDIGGLYLDGGVRKQFFLGHLPVLEGL
jgi:hypothetical protein